MIQLVQDRPLHREALQLAQQFALPATYNAHYLSLAHRLEAPLWTADRRLYRAVSEAFTWIHLLF